MRLCRYVKENQMKIGFYDPYVKSGYEKTLGVDRYDSLDNLQFRLYYL